MRILQQQVERAMPQTWLGMRELYKRFTILYADTSATLNHYVSSTFNATKVRDAISHVYHDTAKRILGDKKQKFEVFSTSVVASVGREAQKHLDQNTEFLRQNYRFALNSASAKKLSLLIAGASMGALLFLPKAEIIPCIATVGFMLGSAGLATMLSRSLDLGAKHNKNKDIVLKMSHEVAKSVCAMVIHAKLAVLFTAMISASIAASPLTCAIVGSVLASVATASIISAIVYGEQLVLPRDIRNILYTSVKDELTKLLKSKQKYIDEIADNLTAKQLEILKQEAKELSEEINTLQTLENKIRHIKEVLEDTNLDAQTRKNLQRDLTQAMRDLHITEQKYLQRYHSKSIVGKILPTALSKLIGNVCPGFFIRLIIHNAVQALFKENSRITPSKMYNIIKIQLLESFITCGDFIQNIVSYLTPEQQNGKTDVIDIILNDEDLLKAAQNLITNAADEKLVEPILNYVEGRIEIAEEFVSSTIFGIDASKAPPVESKAQISDSAENLVGKVAQYAASTKSPAAAKA